MTKFLTFPGLIDIHVHLRDPGQTAKEDFRSGTRAALAGGVTTVFDMPNNIAPLTTYHRLVEKMMIGRKKAVCNFGLYFGTDGKNTEEFVKAAKLAVGLKVYLEATTGKLILEDQELVEKVFCLWPKNKIIVIHTKEEKIDLALKLTQKYGNKIHITHVNNKSILETILKARKQGLKLTCDTTPHYLFLTKDDAARLGGLAVVEPPLASRQDQDFLWAHLGEIDCLVTDHAPHTLVEKRSVHPPSGMPGLETMLPLLLTAAKRKIITVEEIIRLTNTNPQKIFGFRQDPKTYLEVDSQEKFKIDNGTLFSKCGWSPFTGWEVYGRIKKVFLRGRKVFADGKILVKPGFGRMVKIC